MSFRKSALKGLPTFAEYSRGGARLRRVLWKFSNLLVIAAILLPGVTDVAAAMQEKEKQIPRGESASAEASDRESKNSAEEKIYQAPIFKHADPRKMDPARQEQSAAPIMTPVGWSGEVRGSFDYSWSGMDGQLIWQGDGGSWQLTRAYIDFAYENIPNGSTIVTCSKGNIPYSDWYSSNSTRRNISHASPNTNWNLDGEFDVGAWRCVEQPLDLRYANGIINIGHFWGSEGRNQPGCCDPILPADFNWQTAIKTITYPTGEVFEYGLPDIIDPQTDIHPKSVLYSGEIKNSLSGNGEIPCQSVTASTEMNNTQGFGGDPINTQTGTFSFANVDISIPTRSCNLAFQPAYSSAAIDEPNDALGFGWTHNHALKLIFPTDPGGIDDYVLFQEISGNRLLFKIEADGSYIPWLGVTANLTRIEGPPVTYQINTVSQKVLTFDENGLILARIDAQGYGFTYSYDVNGRLTQVSADDSSRYLNFTYGPNDRISSVTDHTGRQVSYAYDANGDLVSSIDVLGQTWTYSYDTSHHMTQMIDPGVVTTVQTEYDAQGRAFRQYDALGNLLVEITYNADGTSTVYDTVGNSSTHTYDSRNTLTDETDPLGASTAKTYDANFRPSTITDAGGDTTSLTWSANGANLTQVIDAAGNQTDLGYDALNNLTSVTDAGSYLTTYTYDGTLLTSSTDALFGTTSYTYTLEGDLESVTDPLGNTTSYTYDQYGQMTSMNNALGNSTSFTYDNLGRLEDTTDALGRVTHNEYDPAGRLVKVTRNYDPARLQNAENLYNIVTTYQYDAVGNQTAVTDTYGNTTQYVYDNAGRLVTTIDPLGNQTSNTYNALGQLVATTDALGRSTSYGYDAAGRLISTTDALGNVTTTTYNLDGTVASTTDASGNTTSFGYDELKRVVSTMDALGGTTTTTYDQLGNVASTTDALGRTTTYEYDALGRLIRQTDPLLGVTENFYDAAGNRVQTIDPRGNTTTYAYDALGRFVTVTDALGNITSYTYNQVGQRTAVSDALGRTTTYAYDTLGRLISTTDAQANTSTTTYDALGRVTASLDALGRTTHFVYDALGRLASTTNPASGTTSFGYDPVGNQTSVTNPNGATTTRSYDALNRPVTVTDANGNITSTSYNAVGAVVSTTDAMGDSVSFSYDALGRQTGITDPMLNSTQYSYDTVGNRVSMTSANGVLTNYEYDGLNRLTAVVENFRAGFTPDHEINVRTEYAYDAVGNRLSITDGNGHVTSFGYDSLNRLVSESDALTNTWSYGYDAVGNRVSMTDANGASTSYIYDSVHRLSTIDYPAADPDVSFSYDAAGQRTSMTDGMGTTTWSYDALGRPTSITDPFGGMVGYSYDAVGNRTGLTYPDGKSVHYSFDPANRLVQVTDWENLITSYNYNAANRLATANLPNGVASTYTYDAAGRLLALEHAKGVETLSSFQYTYDTVGNRVQVVENIVLAETVEPTPTATSTPTSTATATPTPTVVDDLIFADGFESGDFSAWWLATSSSALEVTTQAAYEGAYGAQLTLDGPAWLKIKDDSPNSEPRYRMRFYLDPNSIQINQGNSFEIMYAVNQSGSRVISIYLGVDASGYYLQTAVWNDALDASWGSRQTISNGWHAVEIDWAAATTAGANDGYLKLWVDEALRDTLSGVDNDTHRLKDIGIGATNSVDAGTVGTFYLDAFESRRQNYIGALGGGATPTPTDLPPSTATATPTHTQPPAATSTNTPLPTDTPTAVSTNTPLPTNTYTPPPTATPTTVNDLIFEDGFESGDFSAWWLATSDPDLQVSSQAAFAGSYGTQLTLDGPAWLKIKDDSPNSEPRYRVRFYFDPNSLQINQGNSFEIMYAVNQSGSRIISIYLGNNASGYFIKTGVWNDALDATWGNEISISDNWHPIEIDWSAASSAGANDGYLKLWVDEVLSDTLGSVDNDTHRIKNVAIGATNSVDAGTVGTFYLDAFESRRISYIGPISTGATPTPTTVPSTATPTDLPTSTNTPLATATPSPAASATSTAMPSASPTTAPTATPTPGDMTLNDGVLAHWKLDEAQGTRNDSAGLNHLTDNNSVAQTAGKIAEAASFVRGNSEYLSIADNPELSMGDVDFTMAGWVYFDTKQTVQDRNEHLFGKYDWNSNQREYFVYRDVSLDRFRFAVSDDGINTTQVTAESFGAPLEGQWYFVVAWQDAAIDTLNIQVDNGAVDTVSHTTGVFDGSASFTIGGEVNSMVNFLEGRTDSVTVWNRVLSADERTQLFNNASGLDYPFNEPPPIVTTISYAYDPLGRLTAADYSSGEFFHYTYDAVGNRLTQDTLAGTNTYAYDVANRLSSVAGVPYVWDANGNLLSDGVSTYTYNAANRLIEISNQSSVSSYQYNGLGDRMQQTIDSVLTNYTLDLNTSLTQVLADSTNVYLYGLSRIGEQQSSGWAYHHGDALGSVRQLSDPTGAVTLAQSYAPYGDVLNSAGDGVSVWQFTGEARDATGLTYLRARYLDSGVGRFISRDTWGGDFNRPLSLNRWGYVEGNPVNLIDPSGRIPCSTCQQMSGESKEKCLMNCCPEEEWKYVGVFNLSAYYVVHETQFYPGKSRSIPSLGSNFTANKYFLFSKRGVCMQGSGKLKDGGYIGCIVKPVWSEVEIPVSGAGWIYKMPPDDPAHRDNLPFFWKTEDDFSTVEAFETAAVCKTGLIPRDVDGKVEIRINNDIFEGIMKNNDADNILRVTDVGGGLCDSNGIDVFLGEQPPYQEDKNNLFYKNIVEPIILLNSVSVEMRDLR